MLMSWFYDTHDTKYETLITCSPNITYIYIPDYLPRCYWNILLEVTKAFTVSKETNGTRPSIWREIGVLWAKITYLKSVVMLFLGKFQKDMTWGFQMSYYLVSYIKRLQNCDLSNLEVQMLALLLSKKGFKWVRGRIFFGPPTLTGHIFVAAWAMIIKSGSFESP